MPRPSVTARLWGAWYRARVLISCLVLLLMSFVVFQLERFIALDTTVPFWIREIPYRSIGDAMFIAAVITLTFEYFVRVQARKELAELFQASLHQVFQMERQETTAAIRRSLLLDADIQRDLIAPATLDRVLRTCIQTKLGDATMGTQVFDGPISRMLGQSQRWQNYKFSAMLSELPPTHPMAARAAEFFVATVVVRYETVFWNGRFRFVTVANLEAFNEAIADPHVQMAWLFPDDGVPDVAEHAMIVDEVKVANVSLARIPPASSSLRGDVFSDSGQLIDRLGKTVVIDYKLRALLHRIGHSYHVAVPYPTHNCSIELDFAKIDVEHMDVIDYFPSSHPTVVRFLPLPENYRKIEVGVNGWVFPKAGVIFVWSLKSEVPRIRRPHTTGEL